MNYQISDKMAQMKPSAIREIFKSLTDPSVISLAAGNPAPEAFPVSEINAIADEILKEQGAFALQYGITEGYTPLREKIRKRISQKLSIGKDTDELIITSGAQQGIDLTCKVLCNEGDVVLCEEPSFIGALNAFRANGARVRGIPIEEDGISLTALEEALKEEKNAKLLYIIPTFQNPSGITTSEGKRRAVYALAKKYGIIILEDNPYGELRFKGKDEPTIKSMDEDGIVMYSGSFSKILSPGMRVGFLCGPSDIVSKVVVAKQVNDVHTNLFFQMVADRYMEKYDLDTHIKEITALYEKRAGQMLDAIDTYFDKRVKTTRPEGGFFLWVTLPDEMDMMAYVRACTARKVAVVPGNTFQADEDAPCHSVRLNFSMPTAEQIEKAVRIMGEIQKEMLG